MPFCLAFVWKDLANEARCFCAANLAIRVVAVDSLDLFD
jgi:hypothetical protein